MEVDVSELLAFADKVDAEAAEMGDYLVEAVTEACEIGATVARAWAPRGETGDLQAGIEVDVKGSGRTSAGVRGIIRANVSYSWFVNAGTARQAPNPFADRGRDAAEPALLQRLEKRVDKAFR